ncbi:ribonuclease R [Rubinisphaera italica]|uniref:Ribonuclease R n=1 Tax=Rubinisphaera italica TaxID=2527969 RepID=A0A5C5XFZ6_9PLAN|nr:ribonuclease R [Rubinisphaera italica]TWT61293.1 Ribonuclease R [Rubinisphaera italica]
MASLKQQVIDYLSRANYQPSTLKSVAKKLALKKKDRHKLDQTIQELIDGGKVQQGETGLLHVVDRTHQLIGIFRKVTSGNGYVILHEPKPSDITEDIFIEQRDTGDAQTGDEVAVALNNRRKSGNQRCGRIAEVIKRARNRFVGVYFEEEGQGYVFIDGKNYEEAIWVGDPGAKGVRPDDKVVIEMVRFPNHYDVGEAVLVEVLGDRNQPGVDTLTVIHEYGLPTEFSEEALEQATQQTEQFDEKNLEGRLDLTLDPVVTIDPISARDFDDAISLVKTDNGHFHLGVHIADVSHFVTPNSPLDREAYKRATSVYLPTKVIPMLPEVLSNGLASLQQDRVRFVKSAFIEFNAEGIPVDTRFANSVIKVKKRFAYEDVSAFLKNPEKYRGQYGETITDLLLNMQDLARKLRKRRFDSGALELSMPEIKLSFDADGKVTGAFEADHDESHQIIEEFMLAANIAVATSLNDRGVSFLRRTHGDPSAEKMKAFSEFVESLGLSLTRSQSRHDIQELLDATAGTPLQKAVHFAFLRSLQQAEYSPEEVGHYALAAEQYCHFTSPIRRYPDLTIHRIVDRLLIRGEKYKGENPEFLNKVGIHCSDMSRRAERAERELTKLKLLEYIEQFVGQEFDAVVTGVERFGIFCQCLEVPAEGMVHISSLSDVDQFYFDRDLKCLIGKRTDIRIRLGMTVRVKITHVDVDRRELDMMLIKVIEEKSPRKRSSAKKRPNKKTVPKKKPNPKKRRR